MNVIWLKMGWLTAGLLLVAGCNTRESLQSSFRDAPWETRTQVEEAWRLDQGNDYMNAAEHYGAVLNAGLTSQQRHSVQAAVYELFTRMRKAAHQGDLGAKQTLEMIDANKKAGSSTGN